MLLSYFSQVLNDALVRVKILLEGQLGTQRYRSRHLSDGNIIVDTAGFGSHGRWTSNRMIEVIVTAVKPLSVVEQELVS